MNNAQILALMDPAGAPSHPAVFLILLMVTFALHMAAVNVMLGTLGLALFGSFAKNPFWQRLSGALGSTAKVSVSIAVVLGVAPLLFVQVVYDPFWYTSNVLSAWWLLIFLAVLTAAYLSLYRWYGLNHRYAEDGTPLSLHGAPLGGKWLLVAFVLMLICGFIIHSVTYQSLFPAEWLDWYAPMGRIAPEGRVLHAWSVPRFLFFITLSLPVTAGWLFGMRRYLLSAGEKDFGYIDFIESVAHRLALWGSLLLFIVWVAWLLTLPETMVWFRQSIWVWLFLIPLGYFLAMSVIQKRRKLCIFCNYMGFVSAVVMTVILALIREVLRFGTLLNEAGWDALSYTVNMDWPSTLIFFTTFLVVGGLNLAFLISLAWKTGQTEGVYTPGPTVSRLGLLGMLSIAVWIAGYCAVGLYVMAA